MILKDSQPQTPEEIEFLSTYTLIPFERAVNNPNLTLYQAIGPDRLLVKKFSNPEAAGREVAQYALFANLPFIPKLVRDIIVNDGRLLAYEWIEGTNFYDALRQQESDQEAFELWVISITIRHALAMGNSLFPDRYNLLKDKSSKYSLYNPLYRGVLSPEEEQSFDKTYTEVQEILALACEFFPGIFSDRNPGNILVTSDQKILQVDFGLIETTSPLFDLVRLLRTRTLEPSTQELTTTSAQTTENPKELPNEEQLLQEVYTLFTESSMYQWRGSFDLFKRAFYFAALNEHIFYLSKAIGLLNSGNANTLVQDLRKSYHSQMLPLTFKKLLELEEPIEHLEPYIKLLIDKTN